MAWFKRKKGEYIQKQRIKKTFLKDCSINVQCKHIILMEEHAKLFLCSKCNFMTELIAKNILVFI